MKDQTGPDGHNSASSPLPVAARGTRRLPLRSPARGTYKKHHRSPPKPVVQSPSVLAADHLRDSVHLRHLGARACAKGSDRAEVLDRGSPYPPQATLRGSEEAARGAATHQRPWPRAQLTATKWHTVGRAPARPLAAAERHERPTPTAAASVGRKAGKTGCRRSAWPSDLRRAPRGRAAAARGARHRPPSR